MTNQEHSSIKEVIATRKVVENYNNSLFRQKYSNNFSIMAEYFSHSFGISSDTLMRSCLEYIHRNKTRTSNKIVFFRSFSYLNFFCFVVICFMMFFKFFTCIRKNGSFDNNGESSFALLDRGNDFLYGNFLEERKHSSRLIKDLSKDFFYKALRPKLGSFIHLVASIRLGYSAVKKLSGSQKPFFIEKFIECVLIERFYKSIESFDYIVDSNDNAYTPLQKDIANSLNIQLILIQQGMRANLLHYGYISCNVFLGWDDIYRDIIVGGVLCDNFLAIGSTSMNRHDSDKVCENYDYLIVEQLTYPDRGEHSDVTNHKNMIDKILKFKRNYPEYKIAYLCRYSRVRPKSKLKKVLSDNDQSLLESGITIIDREYCECVVKHSKVSIALDSSIRLESYLVGNTGFTVSYDLFHFDWLSHIFPQNTASLSDNQDIFENKLIQSLKFDVRTTNVFGNSSYSLEAILDKIDV
jgi:hypothetical protein